MMRAYDSVALKTPLGTHTNAHTHRYTHTHKHTYNYMTRRKCPPMLGGRKSRQVANKDIRTDTVYPPIDR